MIDTHLTVLQSGWKGDDVLSNLLDDTSVPALVMFAERYGLGRIPGLTKELLIQRIMRSLPDESLRRLRDELIAARFDFPLDDLIEMAVDQGSGQTRTGRPRLTEIDASEASLVEGGARRWAYTMRGHDVSVDMENRTLACDCPYFAFASKRHVLCKHLALAFRLIPQVYAREALIDLLMLRTYGGRRAGQWLFEGRRVA